MKTENTKDVSYLLLILVACLLVLNMVGPLPRLSESFKSVFKYKYVCPSFYGVNHGDVVTIQEDRVLKTTPCNEGDRAEVERWKKEQEELNNKKQ